MTNFIEATQKLFSCMYDKFIKHPIVTLTILAFITFLLISVLLFAYITSNKPNALNNVNVILSEFLKYDVPLFRGKVLDRLGQHEKAEEKFIEARWVEPGRKEPYLLLGSTLRSLGEYAQAANSFTQAINFDKTNVLAYLGRGFSFRDLGKNKKAREDFQEALKLKESELAYEGLILTLNDLGEHEKALMLMEKVIKTDLDSVFTRFVRRNIGRYRQKKPNEAVYIFELFTEKEKLYVYMSIPKKTYKGIPVEPENRCADYDKEKDYLYSQTVKEVQAIKDEIIKELGGIYSPYTKQCFDDNSKADIGLGHIVAISEAHDSGLCMADAKIRKAFASDPLNLTLVSPQVNWHDKKGLDATEWLPDQNQCWFAQRIIDVRLKYGLTIDQDEVDVLKNVLKGCESTEMIVSECVKKDSGDATRHSPGVW